MASFSLIIPYYNREKTLQRTLDSVAAQTLRPLEVLLVDNNSTDSSTRIAETFAEKADKVLDVRLLSCPKKGAAAARNVGLDEAKGDYVYFFDSDDEMTPSFFADAARKLKRNDDEALFCSTKIVFPDGRVEVRNYGFSRFASHQILTGFLSTQSVVYRRDFLLRIGKWNEGLFYWIDWELGTRVLLCHPRFCVLKKKIYHILYSHADSITGSSFSEHVNDIEKAFTQVRLNILRFPDRHVRRSLRALSHREAIVAGLMYKEGDKVAAKRVFALIGCQREKLIQRMVCHLFFKYTAIGGKGTWHFA